MGQAAEGGCAEAPRDRGRRRARRAEGRAELSAVLSKARLQPITAGTERASAKVNLALHVTGRREDGYHTLDSLVAFAEIGDDVSLEAADADRLTLGGPFAGAVPAGPGNILTAALALARALFVEAGFDLVPLAVYLDKHLPVASGIGGGSADAAALLRRLFAQRPDLAAELSARALALGADVPMCLAERPCRVGGIGEALEPLAAFPSVPIVLVNPGTPVSTPAVFRALERRDNAPLPAPPQGGFRAVSALVDWLAVTRNDLEAPARTLAPAIGTARETLIREGALFARMSGSGATVFGLFAVDDTAARAAAAIQARHPGWWVAASRLRPAGKAEPTSATMPASSAVPDTSSKDEANWRRPDLTRLEPEPDKSP